MKIKSFEDLTAWQLSHNLAVTIYGKFQSVKDFAFKDQIQRASISVSNNVAEGFDRNYTNEFRRFLFIAKASCGEVKSMTYLAERLNYISMSDRNQLLKECDDISKVIYGLIKSLK